MDSADGTENLKFCLPTHITSKGKGKPGRYHGTEFLFGDIQTTITFIFKFLFPILFDPLQILSDFYF